MSLSPQARQGGRCLPTEDQWRHRTSSQTWRDKHGGWVGEMEGQARWQGRRDGGTSTGVGRRDGGTSTEAG